MFDIALCFGQAKLNYVRGIDHDLSTHSALEIRAAENLKNKKNKTKRAPIGQLAGRTPSDSTASRMVSEHDKKTWLTTAVTVFNTERWISVTEHIEFLIHCCGFI